MIRAWRLTRRAHATPPKEAFSGRGAERRGGRWNRVGTRASYASSTRSLAALEYLANIDPDEIPDDLVFVAASFDDDDARTANPPEHWDAVDYQAAVAHGEEWLRSRSSLALAVPSAIIKAERNYVLNPAHPRAGTIKVARTLEDFVFDARLLTKR